MAYLIEKAASAYVTEKADGLNIEESFFLYILAQNWSNGDEFSWACGGVEEEWVSLVEEARWGEFRKRNPPPSLYKSLSISKVIHIYIYVYRSVLFLLAQANRMAHVGHFWN